jgi:transient receptor potential cation channel subfamily A member 1
MINEQDLIGNTPLHISIEDDNEEVFKYLIEKGANTSITNESFNAPIHQCIVSNKPKLLELLLPDKTDIHLPGLSGFTALHYCAFYNNLECAKILRRHNAEICKPSNNNYFPIHVAAHSDSNDVLEYLFIEGQNKGCSKLDMLSFIDADDNKVLHAAIEFGSVNSARLCLRYGSKIDEVTKKEYQTPVHVACVQGSLPILKLMAESQSETFINIINFTDILGMTPLHKAAAFDHIAVARYLVEYGADINAMDNEKRTPLMLASIRKSNEMICYFIEKGANLFLKDVKLRNFIHFLTDDSSSFKTADHTDNHVLGIFISILQKIPKVS